MRKSLSLLILLIVTVQMSVLAQGLSEKQRFRFGLTASPTINWMRADAPEITDSKIRAGVEYGLLMDVNITDNYAAHTGITVGLTGGSLEYQDSLFFDPVTRGVYKIQQIQVPTVFKLMTNEIGYITYYGMFGLVSGFRFRARFDADFKGQNLEDWENENLIKDANTEDNRTDFKSNFFNLSLHVGGGIEYSLNGNTAVQAGLFFNNGFVNQVNDGDSDKIRLSSMGLRAAVLF